MIRQMVLRNVDVVDDGSGQTQDQFCVDAEILGYLYPDVFHPLLTVDEFYDLACRYLDEHVDRVSDTGSAKIDVWY